MNLRVQKIESLGKSPTLQSLQYYRDCDSPYEQVDVIIYNINININIIIKVINKEISINYS